MERVTQEQAHEALSVEVAQRPINRHAVRLMVKDMEGGRWDVDACPPILLDKRTGAVIDGRHRLTALTKLHDGAVGLFEVRRVNRDAIDVIDTGRPRTLRDTLGTLGYTNAVEVASIVNTSVRWITGSRANQALSRREQIDYVRSNHHIVDAADFVRENRRRKGLVSLPMGAVGTLYDISTYGLGAEPMQEFMDAAITGKGTTDPIRRLTVAINDSRNPKSKTTLGTEAIGYMVARVYLAFLMDENPTKLYARRRTLYALPGWNEWVDANWKEAT